MRLLHNLILIILLCTALAGYAQDHDYDKATLELGEKAPDFSLPGIDGKTYTLNSFKDAKVLAILFTCNHCPTAQAYEDRVIQLTKDYKDMAMVAISPNDPEAVRLDELGYSDIGDSFEEMKERAEEKGYNFPYLYDGETQSVASAYGPVATPHIFIFDENRALRYVGRLDASEKPGTGNAEDARNAIDALLAGKEVALNKTKTFGCSVKWADKENSAQKAYDKWAEEPAEVSMIGVEGIQDLIKNESDNYRLINVWATWCGPCVTEFPEFVKMSRMYGNREFEMITISADKPGNKEKVLNFLNKKDAAKCTNYLFETDDKYALIEAIDENWQGALPYTILVEPGGKIVYARQGEIDPLAMRKLVVDKIGRYY